MGHIRDLWTKPGPNGRRVRTARWGNGQRWLARWTEHGTERSRSFPTRDAAELHLARVAVDGPTPSRQALTVREYADAWLVQQLHYSRLTQRAARLRLAGHILPTLGALELDRVTRADVQALVVDWAGRYAPATVHQSYSFLTTLFACAVRDGLAPASPCAGVNLPPVIRERVTPLTVEQVGQIADRVRPWYRAMVIVGAATGLRGGELRGLTASRIVAGDLVVDRQLAEVAEGRPIFEPPKSRAGDRRVSLGRVAAEALADHMAQYPPGPAGLVFTTRQHGPIRRQEAARQWQRGTAGMELHERTGWHDLRHHHASVLISAGMSPKAVGERLGHADEAEVLRTYAHLWPADHQRMADVVDAALAELRPAEADVIPLRRRVE